MTTNAIILVVFGGLLFFAVCGALGMHIAGEKGRSLKVGFIFGLVPLLGHIALALMPATDANIVDELYARNLISYEDYQVKTREVSLKQK